MCVTVCVYMYVGSGAVEFTIGGDRLVVGNNTVTVTLFGADNSVLGSFPITFEIGQYKLLFTAYVAIVWCMYA